MDKNTRDDDQNNHELTAEWTVHAHLTITRPDKSQIFVNFDTKKETKNVSQPRSDYNKSDDVNSNSETTTTTQLDPNTTVAADSTGLLVLDVDDNNTTSDNDSNVNNNNSNNINRNSKIEDDSKCRSTCNITLSTDFYSPQSSTTIVQPTTTIINDYSKNKLLENNFIKNIKSSTLPLSPKASYLGLNTSSNINSKNQTIYYKDASCQTTCDKWTQIDASGSLLSLDRNSKRSKSYKYRRSTESMLSPSPSSLRRSPHVEGKNNVPSRSIFSSIRLPNLPNSTKNPPNLHIDVYCTGTEDEATSTNNNSSGDYDCDENASNSTNVTQQTVYESNNTKIRRTYCRDSDLPRRLAAAAQAIKEQNVIPLNQVKKIESKSNEVKESKRYLFNRYMGRKHTDKPQNYDFHKDITSDDAISTAGYPNSSSQSTVRNLTSSSVGNNQSMDNLNDSPPIKEREMMFDKYFPSDDNYNFDAYEFDKLFDTSSNVQKSFLKVNESLNLGGSRSDLDKGTSTAAADDLELNKMKNWDQKYALYRTDNQSNLYKLLEDEDKLYPSTSIAAENLCGPGGRGGEIKRTPSKNLQFTFCYMTESSSSTTSTLRSSGFSGYTTDYLSRANKFGGVVSALRKPGHHVGPVRNPECMCEHCKRWVVDREQKRERALSMGDEPLNSVKYWFRSRPN